MPGSKIAVMLAVLLVAIVGFFALSRLAADASGQITVRWLISHQPTEVFDNAVKVFADTLERESSGRMKLKVVMPQELGVVKGDIPHDDIVNALKSGKAEIASVYTVAVAKETPAFAYFSQPFLFADYDAAKTALSGADAAHILASLPKEGGLRGLAFTMSGGFRIIAAKDKAIQDLSDLKGLRIATSGGDMGEEVLRALGAVPVPLNLESGAVVDPAKIDALETTYSRLSEVAAGSPYMRFINETNHSMFLTAIVADSAFFDSLSASDQRIVRDAAEAAAKVERDDSISLGARTKAALERSGSVVTVPSAAFTDAMKDATRSVRVP